MYTVLKGFRIIRELILFFLIGLGVYEFHSFMSVKKAAMKHHAAWETSDAVIREEANGIAEDAAKGNVRCQPE